MFNGRGIYQHEQSRATKKNVGAVTTFGAQLCLRLQIHQLLRTECVEAIRLL